MKSRTLPQLAGARTLLRLAQPADVPAIIRYYTENETHLAPFEPIRSAGFYTEHYWSREVEQRLAEFEADQSLRLFLFKRENPDIIIGSLNFANFIRGAFQSCTLGYSIAAAEQGKGYMSEALKIGIHYGFYELNLHRVIASYLPHNQRSGGLLKRLGFVVEGYARDYLMIAGQWQDHVITSLINPDWQPLLNRPADSAVPADQSSQSPTQKFD